MGCALVEVVDVFRFEPAVLLLIALHELRNLRGVILLFDSIQLLLVLGGLKCSSGEAAGVTCRDTIAAAVVVRRAPQCTGTRWAAVGARVRPICFFCVVLLRAFVRLSMVVMVAVVAACLCV